MFNIFKWFDVVKQRKIEMEGEESFRNWYLGKLNSHDEAVTEEVRRKIEENRKRADEDPDYFEKLTCICSVRNK
ncbi:MAG: hypothetical protein RQ866_08855 [Bacteroidales bacterium]|nr:hypothetical protein [Bacteroidales bacterium]